MSLSLSMSWFLALLVTALSAWMIRLFVRLPPRVERTRTPAPAAGRAQPWQAVRIVPGAGACAAAHAQAARLYPPGHAPLMPLADGGCEHCHCQYETIQDRRRGERRSGMDRRTGLRYEPDRSDRRASRERRRTFGWSGSPI